MPQLRGVCRLTPSHGHPLPTSNCHSTLPRPPPGHTREHITPCKVAGCVMTIWTPMTRQMWSVMQRIVPLVLCLSWPAPTIMAAEPFVVTVDISSRVFIPHRAILHHGQATVLVIRNHDTELH